MPDPKTTGPIQPPATQAAALPSVEKSVMLPGLTSTTACHAARLPNSHTDFRLNLDNSKPTLEELGKLFAKDREKRKDILREIEPDLPEPVAELVQVTKGKPQSALFKELPRELDGKFIVKQQVNPEDATIRIIHLAQNHGISLTAYTNSLCNLFEDKIRTHGVDSLNKSDRDFLADAHNPNKWPDGKFVKLTPQLKENIENNFLKITNASVVSQENIDKCLKILNKGNASPHIYLENFSHDMESHREIVRAEKELRAFDQKTKKLFDSLPLDLAASIGLGSSSPLATAIVQDRVRTNVVAGRNAELILGAGFKGLIAKEIKNIVPTEVQFLHQETTKAMSNGNESRELDLHFMRELAAVKLIEGLESKGSQAGIMIYGSWHNFTQAVETWNAVHPDRKVALTRIDPLPSSSAQK